MPDRDGRLRRVPPARLPPDRDLRRLRWRPRRPRDSPVSTRRRRRARSGSPDRSRADSSPTSRTARRRSRCTQPGQRTARILAARLAPHGAAGPRSVLEGKFGLYHAFLGAGEGRDRHRRASSPTSALAGRRRASPTSRIPVCHFMHGSLGAAAEVAAGRHVRARRDRRRRRHGAGGRRLARARAGGLEDRAALRVRGQVLASSTRSASMLVRGHVGVSRLHRRGDRRPATCSSVARRRCVTRRGTTRRTRRRSLAASASALADGTTLEADFPYQKGGPENPLSGDEVRAKYRENAGARPHRRRSEALEETILALEERDDLRGALSPLCCGRRQPYELARADERAAGDPRRRPRSSSIARSCRSPPTSSTRRVPGGARRTMRRDGALRDDDPRGVRRARARPRHVRADRDGALPRVGDALGDPERDVHRRAG